MNKLFLVLQIRSVRISKCAVLKKFIDLDGKTVVLRRSLFIFYLALMVLPVNVLAQQDKGDLFGRIANIQSNRLQLEEKQPPVLPEKYLSLKPGKDGAFKPLKEISTKEELKEEVKKLREKFLPFMKELAPEMQRIRTRVELNEFQWRMETESDQKEFIETLKGKGNWEKVSIPHFGPPKGRAVTYYYKKINIPQNMLQGKALFACFKGVASNNISIPIVTRINLQVWIVGKNTNLSAGLQLT